jgi:hypothetical protein
MADLAERKADAVVLRVPVAAGRHASTHTQVHVLAVEARIVF